MTPLSILPMAKFGSEQVLVTSTNWDEIDSNRKGGERDCILIVLINREKFLKREFSL